MRKLGLFVLGLAVAACAEPAKQDAKGQVDDSDPPSIPSEGGKADGASNVLPIDVQSAHPYSNSQTKTFPVALTNLPSCAHGARLHFKVLRTEAGYDHVTVQPTGEQFDGNHDDTWTSWFDLPASPSVKLQSDSSITYHGFEIDSYEWRGAPICPAIAWPMCGAGTVDVRKLPGTCECPQQPVCAPIADIEVSHMLAKGFNRTTNAVHGATATYTHPGPADAPQTDTIGTIDTARLADLLQRAGQMGLLVGGGYERASAVAPDATYESFVLKAGPYEVQFIAGQGTQDANVQSIIDDFEALFTCGGSGGLSCGSGYACGSGTCNPAASCVCAANYDPVCGVNGHTYSNQCNADCAQAPVAHTGECGIAGDSCGTIFGLGCKDGFKCRFAASTYEYPFPDAGGRCVAGNYCDAVADCTGLVHPAVVGQWACNANACAWQAGPAWQAVADGHFETAHPYANNTSVWKQLYLPAEATALRLNVSSFKTEAGYDFLEVWTWRNGAWAKDKTYSGATAPASTEEFAGRYHYLRFVSDSSVTASGVTLDAQWR